MKIFGMGMIEFAVFAFGALVVVLVVLGIVALIKHIAKK